MSRPLGYRANALGQVSPLLARIWSTWQWGRSATPGRVAYLFRRHLNDEIISGMRLALIP